MKIACIGVGAVGAWYAGSLARNGHEVVAVARGETLHALQTRGIVLNDGEPIKVAAVSHISEVEHADVIILAMKATGQDLAEVLRGAPGEALVAVTQNSVESAHQVAEVVGTERTLPGVVRGYFHHTGPAQVEFHGGPCSFTTGTWDGAQSQVLTDFAEALNGAAIDGIVREDIFVDVWEKAMFVACCGALGSLIDEPLGQLRGFWRSSLSVLMEEVATAGRARGVPLTGDVVDRTMDFADRMPADSTTSMQRDLADGIVGELDAQVGAIVREAERGNVRAPMHELILKLLLRNLE
ncbi:2-dehydropantoate 2-reductase [Corynebacterium lubricantis]|uniref:2-dehydropantoate 2-reductase n=1 Tax=Corynebacterium lubricantis TaxID=541095 RepID=UPI00035F11EB|nr:2-dehydropantoate 2-reductase [Corynebacterium lubricantis]